MLRKNQKTNREEFKTLVRNRTRRRKRQNTSAWNRFGQRAAELIKQQWGYGIVYVGKYCSTRTANYITKYMLKEDVKHPWFTGRVFTSAGIGRGYVCGNRIRNRFCGKETDDRYQATNGQMMAMPRYYQYFSYSN